MIFNHTITTGTITGWTSTVCQVEPEFAPRYDFYFAGTDEKVYYMFSDGRVMCTTSQEAGVGLYATITYVIDD